MAQLAFAVVSRSDRTHEALGAFCRRLETSTGFQVVPAIFKDYGGLFQAMVSGRVELAWSPPLVAVRLERQRAAVPLAVVRRGMRAGYHSALIAAATAPYRQPSDLVGVRVGWVDRNSAAGYFVPRWQLRAQGLELARVFSEEIFLESHDAVAEAVLAGAVDVGATHVNLEPVTGKLAKAPWLSLGAPAAAVRVLLLVGPIPGDVVVASSELELEARRRIGAALLSFRGDALEIAESIFQSASFEPVPEGHLRMLHELSRYETDA